VRAILQTPRFDNDGERSGLWSNNRTSLRNLGVLIVLSSLGGITSVLVGYSAQLLSPITLSPFVTPQLMSGFHVFWLILAALMVPRLGSATTVGALKGLIEVSFISHLGPFSFLVSFLEGAVADLVFAFLKRGHKVTAYAAGGLSSASNLLVVQIFFLPPLPLIVYALAYCAAFLSGVLFAGYLATRVLKVVPASLQTTWKD
jgi:ABC-type thiamin/hydroxymethylpyrimidine transport system permease subunit